MIRCLYPGCNLKLVGTDRAMEFKMCEPHLEGALKEVNSFQRARMTSLLPVLFYGDLHLVVDRLGMRKNLKDLGLFLELAPSTLRIHLKFAKRRRLPGWLAHALYKPLFRTCGHVWLKLLPVRVSLVCNSALRRRYRLKPFQDGPSISIEDYLSRRITSAGSVRMPTRCGPRLSSRRP